MSKFNIILIREKMGVFVIASILSIFLWQCLFPVFLYFSYSFLLITGLNRYNAQNQQMNFLRFGDVPKRFATS